jgi:hypothetical protein
LILQLVLGVHRHAGQVARLGETDSPHKLVGEFAQRNLAAGFGVVLVVMLVSFPVGLPAS